MFKTKVRLDKYLKDINKYFAVSTIKLKFYKVKNYNLIELIISGKYIGKKSIFPSNIA